MKVAGTPLCVHCRMPRKARPGEDAPHIVQFYCSHGRDHGDQSGLKDPRAPQAARADRSQEKIRTEFSNCSFKCTVRRDVLEDDDDASLAAPVAVSGPDKKPKHLKNQTELLGYFDSIKRQQERKTRGPKSQDNQVWTHSGHLKSTHTVGKVTPDMLSEIGKMAEENIAVPSMQSVVGGGGGVSIGVAVKRC
jgi:hypothetical protein